MTATATPSWLLQREVGLCPCGCVGRRTKADFVERTISGAAGLMRQAMFSDDTAAERGLLQALDARVKIASVLGLLVVAALVRHVPVLVAMYAGTLVLAARSHISLRFFVKRVWLFIPIFTGIVVLPATFSFVTHGHIVVPLGSWFGHRVGLTSQGLTSAALIVCRVAVSISLVVLLTLTTAWTRLLAALRALCVPRIFILVIAKARTITRTGDAASGRAFVAATAGALFGKAHALSEEVHLAMVSRGFTGDVRTIDRARITVRDLMWTATCVVSAVAILGGDRVLAR
jgi:energy-coupling factor transporter transmembrane protein EcfT